MGSTNMDGQNAIVFFMNDRQTGVCGYTWYIESHRTSFYIKSTFKPMQMTKVSVHGPDPNHIGKQHFRLDFTGPDEARKAVNAGAAGELSVRACRSSSLGVESTSGQCILFGSLQSGRCSGLACNEDPTRRRSRRRHCTPGWTPHLRAR
jgi:hypothetical protein